MGSPRVFFDIGFDKQPGGRIGFELRSDVVPKTAENFRVLCTKPEGDGFKGSIFHQIIPGFLCQGGDFTKGNDTGEQIHQCNTFPDENFILKHEGEGILSMANVEPNTNGSQFFICTDKTSWLDGKHVVFGRVVEGYDVVQEMESKGWQSGKTSVAVRILDCGTM